MNSKRMAWRLSEDKTTYVCVGLPIEMQAEVAKVDGKFIGSITTQHATYKYDNAVSLATAKRNVADTVRFLVNYSTLEIDSSKVKLSN